MLKLEKLTCGYHFRRQPPKVVLEDVSLSIGPGEIWCILGPNGIGKTTLFKTILGLIPPIKGEISLDQKPLFEMSSTERARRIGYVPQSHIPPFPFSVSEVILMGRNAHLNAFAAPAGGDLQMAQGVMEQLGILELADTSYTHISGGERQLVLIARALLQQSKVLLMDEPASNLDYGNQIRILTQMQRLAAQGTSVVFTSHHPEHAFLCHAQAAVLRNAKEILCGSADDIITGELIRSLYGIDAKIIHSQDSDGREVHGILPFLSTES